MLEKSMFLQMCHPAVHMRDASNAASWAHSFLVPRLSIQGVASAGKGSSAACVEDGAMELEAPDGKVNQVQPERLSRASLDKSSGHGMADPAPADTNSGLPRAPSLPADIGDQPSSHRPGKL